MRWNSTQTSEVAVRITWDEHLSFAKRWALSHNVDFDPLQQSQKFLSRTTSLKPSSSQPSLAKLQTQTLLFCGYRRNLRARFYSVYQ